MTAGRIDVEADIRAYARNQRRTRKRAQDKAYRARMKTPVPVEWTPPPAPPRVPKSDRIDWRVALDRRISRCPGCDDWQFDGKCVRCVRREVAA